MKIKVKFSKEKAICIFLWSANIKLKFSDFSKENIPILTIYFHIFGYRNMIFANYFINIDKFLL